MPITPAQWELFVDHYNLSFVAPSPSTSSEMQIDGFSSIELAGKAFFPAKLTIGSRSGHLTFGELPPLRLLAVVLAEVLR